MITLRKSAERGYADHGWLKSFHSFSFADYHDPRHMGVGNLRVINEDRIAPGTGFGTHGHRDMEIVSYVLEGALAHKDSMGNGSAAGASAGKAAGVILPGDVQRMSAGTGVRHSEFNHATDATTHFLQIWVLPDRAGIAPGYEQKHFDTASKCGRLVTVASPVGAKHIEGSVTIHADATLRAGLFSGDERAELALDPDRITYVHLVRGGLRVNDRQLRAGDAARLDRETALVLEGGEDAEVLVFDLALNTAPNPSLTRQPTKKSNTMSSIVIVYHSGYGHTKKIAEAVAEGSGGALLAIDTEGNLPEGGWEQLAAAKAIVFGSPTYMGTVSWQFKKFADASSKPWFTQQWKNKLAAGFTNSATMNGDKLSTLHYMFTLSQQHSMLWVGSGLMPSNAKESTRNDINYVGSFSGLMTATPSNASPDEMVAGDIATALAFGKRVVEALALLKS